MVREEKGRVVLIGDTLVGKSSIVKAYKEGNIEQFENNTVGAVMHQFTKIIDEKEILIEVYDTAGQEKYRSLGPIYYRGAKGALAVFSLTSHESFVSLKKWITTFKESTEPGTFVFIIANKSDLKDEWTVTMEEALNFSNSLDSQLFYTSALTGEGIDELFNAIFQKLMETPSEYKPKIVPKKNKNKSGCC